MGALGDWFADQGRRFGEFVARHYDLLRDTETVIGAAIVAFWAVVAGAWAGLITVAVFLAIGLLLHAFAVESGSHVLLWLTTAALLILIVVASQVTFDGLPPVLLAAAGASALGHNELVRISYNRRRNAVVRTEVFWASGLATIAAGAIGVVGVALAAIAAGGDQRNWLWMPIAVAVLMLVGFGLAIGPARRSNEASKERWEPGERLPPQPLPTDTTDHY